MSSSQTQNNASQVTLKNVFKIISNMSPFIVIFFCLGLSFAFSDLITGLIYISFLIAAIGVRIVFIKAMGYDSDVAKTDDCNNIQYLTKNFNITFPFYVLFFSFWYVCLPMFLNKNIDWFIVSTFLLYIVFLIVIKSFNSCFSLSDNIDNSDQVTRLFIDFFASSILSICLVCLFYYSNSKEFLFFGTKTSDASQCSLSKKVFKCSVRENGSIA